MTGSTYRRALAAIVLFTLALAVAFMLALLVHPAAGHARTAGWRNGHAALAGWRNSPANLKC